MALKRILLVLLLSPLALAQAPKPAGPPPTLKSVLLAQLRSTHNKAEWFVPLNTAVAGLTPEQARWVPKSEGPNNPAPEDHSVGMIAYHLLYWNEQALHQLKGEKVPPPTNDNTETFNKFDAANWADTVKNSTRTSRHWRNWSRPPMMPRLQPSPRRSLTSARTMPTTPDRSS